MTMLPRRFKPFALGMMIGLLPWAQVAAGGVPKPVIPKAAGERCVEDTDYMRRNHMKLLNHHRDKTVHEGIRTKQHSLKNCIDCHATADASGQRSVLGEDHFCQSCHTYAAVSIDCFGCHSSKPAARGVMPASLSGQSSVFLGNAYPRQINGSDHAKSGAKNQAKPPRANPSVKTITGGMK